MEKKEIRKQVFAHRREQMKKDQERLEAIARGEITGDDTPEWIRKSDIITEKLVRMEEFIRAKTIYVYMSCKGEVSTDLLIALALQAGKKVAAPKVHGKDMVYYYINSFDDVEPGYYDIPEPITGDVANDEDALLIVPGVGFDANRHRCGYGGGFYDRYLEEHTQHTTVAIAFEYQVVEEVPCEPHDIFPQYVITEERFFADPDVLLETIGQAAKRTEPILRKLSTSQKDEALLFAADQLVAHAADIIAANEKDIAAGRANQMPEGLIDRLRLDEKRIAGIAEGIRQVAGLDDPIGEVKEMKRRPNGLLVGKKTVPLGVVGMIYESRPNVTADAFALCFKTGNAVILKGGSDAINSNMAIVKVLQDSLAQCRIPHNALQLIQVTDRETTSRFMKLKKYVDVLIPRGGAGLIRAVVDNSTIPVIETGTGNCHIYVDETADIEMAVNIINNAKTQRIGVCNACESVVVHENVVDVLMSAMKKRLDQHQVELRCDPQSLVCIEGGVPATEEDWGKEYLDYILSVKTVSSIDDAIAHINKYNTGHSESIITSDYANAMRFLDEVDAAAVYVNASTRFSDGFEFGFGAEIGISTQKLHARGPMGLDALTTTKFIIFGNGQVRE